MFAAVLKDFAIPDTSLKQTLKKKSVVKHHFSVTLTGDLPVPLILADLQTRLSPYGIEVIAHEAKINGETDIELYSPAKKVLLHADVTINKIALRSGSSIAIIIQGLDHASLEDRKTFCKALEETACIITPSKDNKQILSFLSQQDNAYLLELSDDIPDQEYKFLDDFSKKRLAQSLGAIASDFPHAFGYYVNTQSKFYHSTKYQIIKAELSGKKIVTEKNLFIIPYQNEDAVFQNAVSHSIFNRAHSQTLILAVDYRNYNLLSPFIATFTKKGGKVIKFTAALN